MTQTLKFMTQLEENQPLFDALVDGVRQYNHETLGDERAKPLSVAAYDDSQKLIGGVFGRTIYRNFLIQVLWVDKAYRGQGLGKKLMLAAEEKAISQGCVLAQLDTLSVQAPDFYHKLGFNIVGAVPAFEGSPERIFLTKNY